MKHSLKLLYRLWPRSAVPAEAVESIVDLVNRGVSVAEIAREWLTAKRSRREMAPQQLEKIESAPVNGMGGCLETTTSGARARDYRAQS